MEQASNVGDTRKLYQIIHQVNCKPLTLSDSVCNNSAKFNHQREHFDHLLEFDEQLSTPSIASAAEIHPSSAYAV
ncbi:unnamed protein product [Schistocephalus solidus]|uniref:Uncharacterized protein n=1 Tax=Schistocephalus solidus TaxID=70667 RepID=A0A183SXJ2_SCHSO|nr:unnamed protein product [Schistocephalus solidus]